MRLIVLAQALLDLGTCFLVAWLASRSRAAPGQSAGASPLAALWLAATCPFVANYAAVPLTEVLATFLTAAALIPLVGGCGKTATCRVEPSGREWRTWFLAGLLVGLGTLVRPETPLLLLALASVLVVPLEASRRLGQAASRRERSVAVGLLLPLLPWAARNWVRFHEVQFLAPRYAASPDEYTPRGLYAWTVTWLVRYRDVYLVSVEHRQRAVEIDDIPPAAFDSPDERARVAALLDQYNATLRMTPEVDHGFAQLARERTARHPLRTYLWVPLRARLDALVHAARGAAAHFRPSLAVRPAVAGDPLVSASRCCWAR